MKIANQNIGKEHNPFIIAEVGINHNGSLDLAKETILSAHQSGASAVKIQTFKANSLCAEGSQYYDIFKKCEFSESQLIELYQYASKNNINLFSTVFDEWAVDICSSLNPPCIKIASGDITHIPLIEYTASKGFTIILSTGASTLSEVEEAVNAINSIDKNLEYCILHCVSNYPTRPAEANLLAMTELSNKFKVPIGFSDHTDGNDVSIAAVSLGAQIIEKHFTLDKTLDGPDHSLSSNPEEFNKLVNSTKTVFSAKGIMKKQPVEDINLITQIRRSIFASCDISYGTLLEKTMLSITRPIKGIEPKNMKKIIGMKAIKNISKGDPIQWSDIEMI